MQLRISFESSDYTAGNARTVKPVCTHVLYTPQPTAEPPVP